ncbi:CP2 transcription factor-domain-containing protein, partial [Fennellomyces sp. T-0311]
MDVSLRYEIILEAPTAAAQKVEDAPLTYLNKGQFYNINLKDTEGSDTDITSTITIMFHDESHRKVAPNYWKFWLSQQKHSQAARALDIDAGRCSGIHNVEADRFDSVSFQWNAKAGASISIRFNCLSTDFSRIKGVKGIPLRLHMQSHLTSEDQSTSEGSYCRIKLFRDKGAERKNKDDARHIEKQLEKLRGKNGESHPLWLAFSQTQPYTVFCEVPQTSPAQQQQHELVYTRRLSDSSNSTAGRQQHHHPYLPPPSLSNSFNGAGVKRQYHTLITPPATDPAAAAAAMAAATAPTMSPGAPNPYFMHHAPVPPMPLDYDPTYVPQRRRRVAKLSIFAKFVSMDDSLHRAIYLDDLTVDDLKEKVTAKMEINAMQISQVVRQVAKKDNLIVRVD